MFTSILFIIISYFHISNKIWFMVRHPNWTVLKRCITMIFYIENKAHRKQNSAHFYIMIIKSIKSIVFSHYWLTYLLWLTQYRCIKRQEIDGGIFSSGLGFTVALRQVWIATLTSVAAFCCALLALCTRVLCEFGGQWVIILYFV